MKRYHLDANVILRFLRNDDPKQSPAAKRLIESAVAGRVALAISDVTAAEVFYALRASYKMSRPETASLLMSLFGSRVFELEHEKRILEALQGTERQNVDFGDAYLAATALAADEPIASFDGDFKRFPSVKWFVP